jgi:HNH endonuclease
MPIPKHLHALVRERGKHRCEYCHYPEILSTAPLSIEHTLPQSLGGRDDFDNLALACRRCNEKRYNFITGIDPLTNQKEPLFNPRRNNWAEHFTWSSDGIYLIGTSAIGRATCNRLDLNDEKREEPFIQSARKQWVASGLHPPDDDPIENL